MNKMNYNIDRIYEEGLKINNPSILQDLFFKIKDKKIMFSAMLHWKILFSLNKYEELLKSLDDFSILNFVFLKETILPSSFKKRIYKLLKDDYVKYLYWKNGFIKLSQKEINLLFLNLKNEDAILDFSKIISLKNLFKKVNLLLASKEYNCAYNLINCNLSKFSKRKLAQFFYFFPSHWDVIVTRWPLPFKEILFYLIKSNKEFIILNKKVYTREKLVKKISVNNKKKLLKGGKV